MAKDDRITVYLNRSLKREVQELATFHNTDTSAYVRDVLKQHVSEQYKEDVNREARAEERIEEAASLAKDEIRQEIKAFDKRARDMQQMTAKTGAYAVAAFRLQAENLGDTYARKALKNGRTAMRENLLADLDVAAEELDLELPDEDAAGEVAMPWQRASDGVEDSGEGSVEASDE